MASSFFLLFLAICIQAHICVLNSGYANQQFALQNWLCIHISYSDHRLLTKPFHYSIPTPSARVFTTNQSTFNYGISVILEDMLTLFISEFAHICFYLAGPGIIVKNQNLHCRKVESKGTFFSESAGEMLNRHIKVPKTAIELIFHELQ